MLQRLVHFIKYHNALPIAISVVVAGSGAAFAATNDAVRSQIVSKEVVVRSVDNSYVLSVDLTAFNPTLQITGVEEDDDFYYVAYAYKTIAIDDYTWKDKDVTQTLAVSKIGLGERDLGAFVAEELGQTVDARMAYLKDVQGIEKKNGVTKKVATVTYSGLVGKFLEPEQEVFEGYTPVKEEPKPYVASVEESKASAVIAAANAVSNQIAAAIPSKEEVERIIEKKVAELVAQGRLAASAAGVNLATTDTATSSAVASTTSVTTSGSSDTVAPVITILGNNPAKIAAKASYVDIGATVDDNVDHNLGIYYAVDGVEVKSVSLDTSVDRTYTITYHATDQAGNTGSATRTVIVGSGVYVAPKPVDTTTTTTTDSSVNTATTSTPVVVTPPKDTTAPVITLLGSAVVTLTVGDAYTDQGATATDAVDGTLTSKVATTGSVDTAVAGTYTLTYTVKDAAGNAATAVTRTVTVKAVVVAQPLVVPVATSTTPAVATSTSAQ